MEDILEKIASLLNVKLRVLEELIKKQEDFKAFLIRPEWHRFLEVTKPQEALLTKLQQIQAAQKALLHQSATQLRITQITTLKELIQVIEPSWKSRFQEFNQKIACAAKKLRNLACLSHALNQAQMRFAQQISQSKTSTPRGVYNARGYTPNPINFSARIFREA